MTIGRSGSNIAGEGPGGCVGGEGRGRGGPRGDRTGGGGLDGRGMEGEGEEREEEGKEEEEEVEEVEAR